MDTRWSVVVLGTTLLLAATVISESQPNSSSHTSSQSSAILPSGNSSLDPHHTLLRTTANGSDYGESLFAPYDPNRHYVHVRYFEVGKLDFEHVRSPFVISCWILIAGVGKMIFHLLPRMSGVVPESCLLITIGILVGGVLNACLGDIEAAHHLDPDTFFLFMLPPIILDAGYFMPNRLFFDNFGTIVLMAFAGTIFNAFGIGAVLFCLSLTGIYGTNLKILDVFLFSTLISAVDPVAVLAVFEEIQVNQVLYIVVFGESLLNDAVTVGLYHMFEEYVEMGEENFVASDIGKGFVKFASASLGGTLIGLVFGLITAFCTRFTHRARVMEPLMVLIMTYLAYLSAEIFHFSGILAMVFCGLIMKNYVVTNVSAKSNTTIKYMTKMLSSSAETAIFMLLGVATVHNNHIWNTWFIVVTLVSCVVFRCVGVVALTWLVNKFRLHPISARDSLIIAYSGLRGAVAFALVMLMDPHYVPEQQMFLTTTIVVVYFTMFLQGMSIKTLVKRLGVQTSQGRDMTMSQRIHERALDHITAGVEDMIGQPFSYNFRHRFKQFNHAFLLPILTRNDKVQLKDPKILQTHRDLVMKETLQEVAKKMGEGHGEIEWSSVGDITISQNTRRQNNKQATYKAESSQVKSFIQTIQDEEDEELPDPVLTRQQQWEARQKEIARTLLRASQRKSQEPRRNNRLFRSFPTHSWRRSLTRQSHNVTSHESTDETVRYHLQEEGRISEALKTSNADNAQTNQQKTSVNRNKQVIEQQKNLMFTAGKKDKRRSLPSDMTSENRQADKAHHSTTNL